MKILLINPPFQRLKGFKNLYFPLGLGYVATAVAEEGFEIKIYDAELPHKGESLNPMDHVSLLKSHVLFNQRLNDRTHYVWKEISNILFSYQPDIVGISVLTPLYGPAKRVTSLCKDFNNKCIVVWGGVHPTFRAEEILQRERDVDFVVRGEGESTFKELVSHLSTGSQDFQKIDGLSFRLNENQIKHNNARDLIKNLDDIPIPRRDLMMNDYPDKNIFKNIIGSRGCPYNCAYCSSSKFWTRRIRYRSIPNIIDEINYLQHHYHITELEFWDDSFTLNRKRTIELCNNIISHKIHISWWCNTRADLIDEEILKIMKKAGCALINIGVETGSERTLSYLNRNLSLKDICVASELLAKSGIAWDAYFMIGFPYETVEDIEQTNRLMNNVSATGISFSIFTPYPETQLFDMCREMGLIPEKPDWSQFSHQSPENHFVKYMGKEDFRKIIFETAEKLDRRNKSYSASIKRTKAKRSYYMRNPAVFIRKVIHKIVT